MKILLVDALNSLEKAVRQQGHEVLSLNLAGAVLHLPGLLARHGFTPDLVLQQERLGPRVFFTGLDEVPCPTVFWAIDTHLNLFWQRWYALLFDAVLTPHVSLFEALPPQPRPPHLTRFAWPGSRRTFKPHAGRTNALGLCARIDGHRPVRAWMTELLAPLGLRPQDGLSYAEMMALYDDSRAVPNESIANEVNFRLMEAASAGCLVLTPDVGDDQNALLEPGTECLVYRDGLELFELASWAAARPDRTEALGRAAMRRIQAEHLPEHRAARLAGLGTKLSGGRLRGDAANAAFWLTLALQARNGITSINAAVHAAKGRAIGARLLASNDATERSLGLHVMTQTLLLHAEAPTGGPPTAEGQSTSDAPAGAASLRGSLIKQSEGDTQRAPLACLEPASACSASALAQGNFPLAGACYLAWSARQPRTTGSAPKTPRTPAELCAAWAAAFARQGTVFWSGFRFAPENGTLPESAFAWLLYGMHREPGNTALTALAAEILSPDASLLYLRLGFLAEQSLAAPGNWRVQQDYGLAGLGACRVEAGLAELREAFAKARDAGRERAFMARLNAKSPVQRSWQSCFS